MSRLSRLRRRPRPAPWASRSRSRTRRRARSCASRASSDPRRLPDVGACLPGVLERVRLLGVLLGLDHHPARVAGIGEELEDRLVVDAAVARDGKDTVAHGAVEALALLAGARHDL